MMRAFTQFACIDWSGAAGASQPGIAVAICDAAGPPRLVQPSTRHWSRAEALAWLLARHDMLIGFDFSASLPFRDAGAFFPGWTQSPADARSLWEMVDRMATEEPNLGVSAFVDHAEAARHFRRHGQRLGDRFGSGAGRLRVTERSAQAMGLSPASSFNLIGAAQVGKASLSGMRLLHRLDKRIAIWPFDRVTAGDVVIVEIYSGLIARAAGMPRGRSKIRDPATLDSALAALHTSPHAPLDRYDDHRTDALLGAAWLRLVADQAALWHPDQLTAQLATTEGWTFGVS